MKEDFWFNLIQILPKRKFRVQVELLYAKPPINIGPRLCSAWGILMECIFPLVLLSLSEENADILSTTAMGFTMYNF